MRRTGRLDLKPVAGRTKTYTVVNELSGKCTSAQSPQKQDGCPGQSCRSGENTQRACRRTGPLKR